MMQSAWADLAGRTGAAAARPGSIRPTRPSRASGMTANASLRLTSPSQRRYRPPLPRPEDRWPPGAPGRPGRRRCPAARPGRAAQRHPGQPGDRRPRPPGRWPARSRSRRPRLPDGALARVPRGRCCPAGWPGPGVQPKLSEAPVTPSSMPRKKPPRFVATRGGDRPAAPRRWRRTPAAPGGTRSAVRRRPAGHRSARRTRRRCRCR